MAPGRGFRIRRAAPEDVAALAELLELSDEPVAWPDLPGWPYLEHLRDHADVLVAVDDAGEPVGFGGAFDVGPHEGPRVRWLSDLFVHPDRQSGGAGHALLEQLLDGAEARMTASSRDPRAMALYVRSGMRPWWPMFYLSVDTARLPAVAAPMTIEPADVGATVAWVERWTGRGSEAAFGYFASLPQARGFLILEGSDVAAVGWSRRERTGSGHWLEHVSIAPGADAVGATVAAFRAGGDGIVGGIVPGPHPALPSLLDAGARIFDWDTFCATDRELVDPERILPNAGLL